MQLDQYGCNRRHYSGVHVCVAYECHWGDQHWLGWDANDYGAGQIDVNRVAHGVGGTDVAVGSNCNGEHDQLYLY